MKIGEKIAKARKGMNFTQDQLAELLAITRQTISKWESDLAFPETAKIVKLAKVLNVSCDYLLQEDKPAEDKPVPKLTVMPSENGYAIDWTKVCPILGVYQSTVDCEPYYKTFDDMIKEMMRTYDYSLDDAMLVLKDLMYQTYLQMQKKEQRRD